MATESSVYSEVLHRFGPMEDHKIVEIMDLHPSLGDLDVVASYCAGMSDVMGEERKPLTGVAARIYDIVRQDELLAEEER